MIDIPTLRQTLSEKNWVVVDAAGNLLHDEVPPDAGPATLLVSKVTDAVKTVADGRVVGSVDRSALWQVEAFLINRIVLDRLGSGSVDAEELLEAVAATGISWAAVPGSAAR
ncbi:MAG: hypothetical protein KY394_00600 [Actinobacteria bacterium]|nr:hypothetical protein [Actinomycetota bacterium]